MKCDVDNFLLRIRRVFRRRMDKKLMGLFVVANISLNKARAIHAGNKNAFKFDSIRWQRVRITGASRCREYIGRNGLDDVFDEYYIVSICGASPASAALCSYIEKTIEKMAGVKARVISEW